MFFSMGSPMFSYPGFSFLGALSILLFSIIIILITFKIDLFFFFLPFVILAFPNVINDFLPSFLLGPPSEYRVASFSYITHIDLYLIYGIYLNKNKGLRLPNYQNFKFLILFTLLLVIYFILTVLNSGSIESLSLFATGNYQLRYATLFLLLIGRLRLNDCNMRFIIYGLSLSIIFLIITVIIFLSLLLAGNRMPTLMFIFSLILFSLLIKKKKYKYHFFFIGTILLLIGTFTLFKSETFQNRYSSFLKGIPNPIHLIKEIQKDYPELEKYKNSGKQFHTYKEYNAEENYELFPHYTGHFPLYLTSLSLFIDDPIFGKGIKSFRNNCIKKVYLPNRVCESHPHNFILEILNDTGVLGLFFILIPVLFVLFNLYREYLIGDKRNNSISNWVYIAIILAIIVQIFPLRSSGSFFSTFNSAYTFLLLGISLGLNEIRFKNINK